MTRQRLGQLHQRARQAPARAPARSGSRAGLASLRQDFTATQVSRQPHAVCCNYTIASWLPRGCVPVRGATGATPSMQGTSRGVANPLTRKVLNCSSC